MIDIRPERGGPDGKYWYAAWTDESGRRCRKALGAKFSTPLKAKRECNRMMAESENGIAIRPGKPPTIANWKVAYFESKRYAKATMVEYEVTLRMLIEFAGDLRLNKYTRQTAASFRTALMGRSISDATICKHIRNCKAIFNEAVAQDIISFSPFDRQVSTPAEVDSEWRYISLDDFDKLMEYTPNQKWRAMLGLTRLAGMRRSEAIRLTWDCVDFDGREIVVKNPRRIRTTKDRTRITPLSPRLYAILIERHEAATPGESLVVGYSASHMSNGNERAGYAQMRKIVRLSGLRAWDKPFHDLRKSLISDWYADGHAEADIVKMLGNSKDVARRFYHQVLDRTKARITGEEQDEKDVLIAQLRRRVSELEAQARLP